MPLIYKIIDSPQSTLAVWKITESIDELRNGMDISDAQISDKLSRMHPKRQIEWLTSRTLLCSLLGEDNVSNIKNDSFGKPYHEHNDANISISHTTGYVAVYISDKNIGIDIQHITPKIKSIAHKFIDLNTLHELHADDHLESMHYLWGAKECMYKCYGQKKLDFKANLKVHLGDMKNGDKMLTYPFTTKGMISKNLYQKEFSITGLKVLDTLLVYAHN